MATRSKNLQQELTKVLKEILDGDVITENLEGDGGKPILEEAVKMLEGLLKTRKASASDMNVPDEFLCHLSKKMMRDPVLLSSGETYERYYIDRWLLEVNHSVCPKTLQPLANTQLIPNKAISSHILQWCKENLVDLPETVAAYSDKALVDTLINKISSSSVYSQREGAKELHCHVRLFPTFCLFLVSEGSSDTLTKLLHPLLNPGADIDPELQSDLIKAVLHLSRHEGGKTVIGQNASIIKTLMSYLEQGSKETRQDAAATFALLASTDSNRKFIASAGVFKPLVALLAENEASVFEAINKLCALEENRDRAVMEGAVRVLTTKFQADAMVDHSLSLLALLSTSQNAVEQMTELALVFTLLKFLRRSTYQPNVENALVIIFNVSERDGSGLEFVSKEEKQKRTLTSVVVNGSENAQKMALKILQKLQVAAGSRR